MKIEVTSLTRQGQGHYDFEATVDDVKVTGSGHRDARPEKMGRDHQERHESGPGEGGQGSHRHRVARSRESHPRL